VLSGSALTAIVAVRAQWLVGAAEATEQAPDVTIENFTASGNSTGLVRLAKVVKSDDAWQRELTPEQFAVTRRAGTEKPFSGAYWDSRHDGLYRCICCNTALFDSSTKFVSHTGWPSFYEPISVHNIVKIEDNRFGLHRTSVSCALCDGHLGDLFQDGPPPTGLRYCVDSAALRFVKRSG